MTVNEIIMSLEIGLIFGIVAIAIYLTFRVIDFPDLTCDGSFVLGAAVSTALIKVGIKPGLSLLAAALAGSIAGGITGILYSKFKVTDLLAGILVSFMLYSINLHIMGGIPNISLINNDTILAQFPMTKLIIISISLCIIIAYILMTDYGLALRSVGQNKKLARNSGISIYFMTITGLMISNAVIAIAGGLFSQYQAFADIGSGTGTVIVGLASVMIGERILPYKKVLIQVISCLIGSIIYRLFIGFALHIDILGLSTSDLNLITGLMVVCIMYIPKAEG